MASLTGMPYWDAIRARRQREWRIATGRVKRSNPKLAVPDRWGMPFWDVVRDLHTQGLNRAQAGKALGYKTDTSFKTILNNNPEQDPWEPWSIAHRYLRETGETFAAGCRRMMAEGYTVTQAMRATGYSLGGYVQFMAALKARGIKDEFLRRGDPRIPLAKRTIRAKELAAGAPHKRKGRPNEGMGRMDKKGGPHPWREAAKKSYARHVEKQLDQDG